MTDAYARWSFLASEDDRVLTFVECVRDESRKYPRPMEASSLSNEPFNLSADEIDELWRTVRDSGAIRTSIPSLRRTATCTTSPPST